MTLVARMGTTNGIEVGPGERTLYVNESVQRSVWAFDLEADGTLGGKRLLIRFADHGLDGMRCDVAGNLYVTRYGKGTVAKISPEGKLLREVELTGARPSNLAFGGPDGRTCYVTLQDRGNVEVLPRRGAGPRLAAGSAAAMKKARFQGAWKGLSGRGSVAVCSVAGALLELDDLVAEASRFLVGFFGHEAAELGLEGVELGGRLDRRGPGEAPPSPSRACDAGAGSSSTASSAAGCSAPDSSSSSSMLSTLNCRPASSITSGLMKMGMFMRVVRIMPSLGRQSR